MSAIPSLKRLLTLGAIATVTSVGCMMSALPASAGHDDRWDRGYRSDRCDDLGYRGDHRGRSGVSWSIRIGSGDCDSRGSIGYEFRGYRDARGYDDRRWNRPVYEAPYEVRVIRPVRPVYVEPCDTRPVGRWERRWVPAQYRYEYDGCNYRRVCVREGYYSRIWIEGRF